MGAASVCLTDLEAKGELMKRNVLANAVGECKCEVHPLAWEDGWEEASPLVATRAKSGGFDWIVASDCVYGRASSVPFANVLLALLRANPVSAVLLAYEERPLPPTEVNQGSSFFELMAEEGCDLVRVDGEELGGDVRAQISLWRGRLR